MTIDSADDSKISNRTINTNQILNRTYDSKSNRITKLRRSLENRFLILGQCLTISGKTPTPTRHNFTLLTNSQFNNNNVT